MLLLHRYRELFLSRLLFKRRGLMRSVQMWSLGKQKPEGRQTESVEPTTRSLGNFLYATTNNSLLKIRQFQAIFQRLQKGFIVFAVLSNFSAVVAFAKVKYGLRVIKLFLREGFLTFLEKLVFNVFGRNVYNKFTAVTNHICWLWLEPRNYSIPSKASLYKNIKYPC